MTDKKSNDSRRKLLKSIAAGSSAVVAGISLPESWSKPVIDAVILPAHAELTDDTDEIPPEVTTTADPCCLTAGVYRDCFGDAWDIEITVDALGNVTIVVDVFYGYPITLTDNVTCDGGAFNASGTINCDCQVNGANVTVTGTVVCGATSISGNVSSDGNSPADYEATLNGSICDR